MEQENITKKDDTTLIITKSVSEEYSKDVILENIKKQDNIIREEQIVINKATENKAIWEARLVEAENLGLKTQDEVEAESLSKGSIINN